MIGKKVHLNFGHVFVYGDVDQEWLIDRAQKAIQVNLDQILDDDAYKARQNQTDRQMKLKVTIELCV